MRLTSTGLGIGTSSPAAKLSVKTTGAQVDISTSATDLVFEAIDRTTTSNPIDTKFYTRNGTFQWYNGQYTERMRLDSSGNLGLGVTPSAWFSSGVLQGPSFSISSVAGIDQTAWTTGAYQATYTGSWLSRGAYAASMYQQQTGSHAWFVNATAPTGAGQVVSFSQAMTLDASGNLLVGTTSLLANASYFAYSPGNTWGVFAHVNGVASGIDYVKFYYNNGQIGSISQNGTTGVLYNITSDYRLKTVTGPVTSAGSRIDALEPVEYTWKSDGSVARGFLAHQFQDVYPNSVTGEKDAVDVDGKPVYQNMQASTSEVIADLVAEIKSLRQRVAQLEGTQP
ncbi:MAG: tail fiber domain-containing protein [Caulobacteraceae bacterium]|nr:tail fiber domain-containing protein [Caulobacteraceae bacterium]